MKLNLSFVLPAATAVVCSAAAAETSKPALSFGKHYAVLNLDLLNGVIATVNTTQAGKDFINSTATWIDAYVSFGVQLGYSRIGVLQH